MKLTKEVINNIENGLRKEYFVNGDSLQSIKDIMKDTHTTALSLAVIKDSEIVLEKGYGITDKVSNRPVNANTLFQAASISKPLTALAVMKLVEDGVLDLDTDINTYLKSWKLPDNEFTLNEAVTLRNLLSHTAGVSVSGFPGYYNDADIPDLISILNGDSPSNTPIIEVDMKPNTRFRYSGGGTTIVQQMLIDQLNKPFQDIMRELVLEPLGMKHSFYKNSKLSHEEISHIAVAHDGNGNQIKGKHNIYPEMAAAGLWTTPGDLSKFVIEVQKSLKNESNKILSKSSIETMVSPVLDGVYSIGLVNKMIIKEDLMGHGGGNAGYQCFMLFQKDKGYGVIAMTNSDNGSNIRMPLLRSIAFEMNWHKLMNPTLEIKETSPDVFTLFTGNYKIDSDQSLTIFTENNKMYCQSFSEGKKELHYVGENKVIDEDRMMLFNYENNKYYMNDKEVFLLNPNEKLACDYIEIGKINEAINCYNDLIDNDSKIKIDLEQKLFLLVYSMRKKGDIKKAINILKVTIEIFPESFIIWNYLGEFYFEEKLYDLTIYAMEKSLDNNPKNDNAKKFIVKAQEKLTKISQRS